MATDFWKRRLERLGERFSNCEAVELSMIRDVERVSSGASPKAILAELLSDAVSNTWHLGKKQSEEQLRKAVRGFERHDPKAGSFYFYSFSLLALPNVDATRLWKELGKLFVQAGNMINDIPASIKQQFSTTALTLTAPRNRWAACVFDLALRLNRVEKTTLEGDPPGCWFATLPDVMAASTELIDWLLAADGTPPTEADGKGEATGGKHSLPKRKTLRPCDRKALSQYEHAMEQQPTLKTDDEAYDWLLDDAEAGDDPLPRRDHWKRYLRKARASCDQQKNGPRIGNETRSVVSVKRLDTAKRTKADHR